MCAGPAFGGDVVLGSLAGLEIELGGTVPGSAFDALDIAGEGLLDGTLDVKLIDVGEGEFAPSAGDSFDIVTADGGVQGAFADAPLPALADPLGIFVRYESTAVTLLAIFTADFDEDDEGSHL